MTERVDVWKGESGVAAMPLDSVPKAIWSNMLEKKSANIKKSIIDLTRKQGEAIMRYLNQWKSQWALWGKRGKRGND